MKAQKCRSSTFSTGPNTSQAMQEINWNISLKLGIVVKCENYKSCFGKIASHTFQSFQLRTHESNWIRWIVQMNTQASRSQLKTDEFRGAIPRKSQQQREKVQAQQPQIWNWKAKSLSGPHFTKQGFVVWCRQRPCPCLLGVPGWKSRIDSFNMGANRQT